MRWRALQEEQIYVKQHIKDDQLDIKELQDMINNEDKNLAKRIAIVNITCLIFHPTLRPLPDILK